MSKAPIIVETGPSPVAACVWLHGLGADGTDFVPIVEQLPLQYPVRFVFPTAPVQPVTLNGGLPMHAWFDIASPDLSEAVDEEGIEKSAAYVADLANQQRLPVMLAGFSQGGLVALHAALKYKVTRQVVALSTWYPLFVPTNRLRVFMGHGTQDTIVPLSLAEETRDVLYDMGAEVVWRTYPMAHSVCAQEVADIATWLNQQLEAYRG